MLPMSVVTMASAGMALSSSRSARRGPIGLPSAWSQRSSSASHAAFCALDLGQALLAVGVGGDRAVAGLQPGQDVGRGRPGIAADADRRLLHQARACAVGVDLDSFASLGQYSSPCCGSVPNGPSRVPSARTTSAWARSFIAALEP